MYGIGTWLTRHAQLHPGRAAISAPGRTYSYGELNALANRSAHALRAVGVSEGDRVGLLSLNTPEFLGLLFGAGKLGAVVVALNYRLTPAELAYQITDSGATALFLGAEHVGLAGTLRDLTGVGQVFALDGPSVEGADSFADMASGFPADEPGEPLPWERPLLMVYTSGTTGRPKGALLTHANQFWNAMNDIVPLRLTADDTIITLLPMVHVGGLGLFTLPALLLGARVVLPRRFEPEQALALIDHEDVSVVMGVPAVFQAMLASPAFAAADLGSVRLFYNGGDRCPLEVVAAFRRRGLPFGGGYGLTETSPTAYMLEPSEFAAGTRQAGFIGKPAPFTEARLVTPEGADAAPDEAGEIWLRGPNVFAGYWQRPEATAEAFVDGWFRTGDLAVRDDEGYTYIVGRLKEMYKSGGLNVYPAEVEAALAEHPAVSECCVIGVADAQWGEVGRAIVALRPDAEASAEELIAWCEGRLARYKQPRVVVFVHALPRNTLGKVNRGDLRREFGAP
ncbi:long-chain fatty acid--CoA ligase [Chloroflexales bacterium ZM16-3]|nr:long-chain fatty acid--CoA ligase [Chloroflexales bacterium ZM16-3]